MLRSCDSHSLFFQHWCCQDLGSSSVEVHWSIHLLVSPVYLYILQGKFILWRFLCCWCLGFCSWVSHWVHLHGCSCLTSGVALVSLGLFSMLLASSWGWSSRYCGQSCLCISRLIGQWKCPLRECFWILSWPFCCYMLFFHLFPVISEDSSDCWVMEWA